jgi:hypothetical protein
VIIGQDADYSSDEGLDEISREEYMEELRLQKIKMIEVHKLDRHISILNPDSI